jgi:hypothetical protein
MKAGLVRAALLSTVLLASCRASSSQGLGGAQFPGGPVGCQARCAGVGLEMSGFVYSGELATSCVCQAARPADSGRPLPPTVADVDRDPAWSARTDGAAALRDDDPLAARGPSDASAEISADARSPEGALDASAEGGPPPPLLQHRNP